MSSSYDPEAHLVQRLADDQYGWLPRLVIGARLRHILTQEELKKGWLFLDPEIVTALFPSGIRFRQPQSLECQMPDDTWLTMTVETAVEKEWHAVWGTQGEPAFWEWLKRKGAQAGDALIFQIQAGASCRLALEPKAAQDRVRIRERTTELADAAFDFVRAHHRGVWLDDIAARLLAQGLYHDPCPPDSLESVVNRDARFRWEYGRLTEATRADHLYQDLGLEEEDFFDVLKPKRTAAPRKWTARRELARKVYRFKAAFRYNKSLWRRIEIRGDQSLRELDREIRVAFGHDTSDHLSEFYLGVDAESRHRGLGYHNPFERGGGDQWRVGELGLKPGDELSYTYDFGDNIQHVLTLEAATAREPRVKYPRVVEQNKPRYRYCEVCERKGQKEVATRICIDCSNRRKKEVLVCEKHIVSDHESHYSDKIVY